MRRYEKLTLVVLSLLTLSAMAASFFTRDWVNYRRRFRDSQQSRRSASLVDTTVLDTAQTLAPLAVTRRERDYAQEAVRLADYSVDLAFSIATLDAENHPVPLSAEMKKVAADLKTAQETAAADQAVVTGLTAQLASASAAEKDRIQTALAIVQTQLSLDQDDVRDLQQQLIRAGADKQAIIQQLLDEHNASEAHAEKQVDLGSNAGSPESDQSRNTVAQWRALASLRAKKQQLDQAQQDALARAKALSDTHDAMLQATGQEQTQAAGSAPDGMAALQRMSDNQKEAASISKRIATEQQLAAIYASWSAFVGTRQKAFVHDLLVSIVWILLIAMAAWIVNLAVQRVFSRVALERRQMHTFRGMTLFVIQAAAFITILIVVFGVPTNLGTMLALITAGVTVVMQDFILAFFGWFVLMGRNGIRPGDWVEIDGVSGEVVDISVFHTVLLEMGSGADAGHPTGRRVSFMNNYAIRGHFFNFSTAGQWMWDEIEVQVTGADPYAKAEAIQKIVATETAENMRVAEAEWNRVAPYYVKKSFSAHPAMSVRPAGAGVAVSVRYITRATERYDLRAKIYRAVLDLLHNTPEPEPASSASSPSR
ncbi:MAG TPA: mechanosensitive ion channel domain-containing protein [Candidatus Acidoferrales bacterium]|nr:mechanosensitive ion channel domain-containing protein [Candidatus Acidoferrales bacterium]